jgi:hypothetical protein
MKTKNSSPSSEFEEEDKCPSCGSPCDIHSDLDDNDECNDCRNEIDGLQIWQRSYSEEEVGELVYNIIGEYAKHYDIMIDGTKLNELFEIFKKK